MFDGFIIVHVVSVGPFLADTPYEDNPRVYKKMRGASVARTAFQKQHDYWKDGVVLKVVPVEVVLK